MTRRTLIIVISAWAVSVLGLIVAVERPSPLFVNLGAGDEAFARGFRGGWERDGLQGSGETMFRWTTDGSRLELPAVVASGHVFVRLRLARFAAGNAHLRLYAGDRLVDEWTQASRGWSLRSIDLGEHRGRLQLLFRSTASESSDGELGVALDWIEARGADRLWPAPELLPGMAVFLLAVPLLALGLYGPRAGFLAHVTLLVLSAIAVSMDRLGGMVAVSRSGLPALLVFALLALAARLLGRRWPEVRKANALAIPALVLAVCLLALFHPFFYYPDVDTHARFVTALQSEPQLALDPRPYQIRNRDWAMRTVGGQRLPFPYSPVFHVLALPLFWPLGPVAAIKTVAVSTLGISLLLVFLLARVASSELRSAVLAQGIFALLPVMSSRLSLALYPALLGQAMEMSLLLGLVVLYPRLTERRAFVALAVLLTLTEAGYTGSVVNISTFVMVFVSIELATGGHGRAASVVGAWFLATTIVVGTLYWRFVPLLMREVIPHVTSSAGGPGAASFLSILGNGIERLPIFYGPVLPMLSLVGIGLLSSHPARRVLGAAFATGIALLFLRFAFPMPFRDVKEVELLAAPVSLGMAAGLTVCWSKAGPWRALAVALGLAMAVWGGARAVGAYSERFLAVGQSLPW